MGFVHSSFAHKNLLSNRVRLFYFLITASFLQNRDGTFDVDYGMRFNFAVCISYCYKLLLKSEQMTARRRCLCLRS